MFLFWGVLGFCSGNNEYISYSNLGDVWLNYIIRKLNKALTLDTLTSQMA